VGNSGLSILYKDKEIYSSHSKGYEMWCTSVMKNKVNVWVGTNEGVKVYGHGEITKPYQTNKYLSSYITCMERLNDSVFLVGTKSYGVLVIKDNEIIDRLDEKNGLAGDLVKAIHVDNRGTLWVGTNTGVSRLYYKGIQNYQIYNLTRKHGLISQEATDIDSYKNTIYILTSKGLISFDRNSVKTNIKLPPVFITGFHVNSVEMNTARELLIKSIPHCKDDINLSFSL
jgi:ligand-binding sensor domain-containing protein